MRLLSFGALCVIPISAWAFDVFIVNKLDIKGIQQVSRDDVLLHLPKIGQVVNEKRTQEIIHELHKTGLFQKTQLFRDGQTLIVKLVERPVIKQIDITGVTSKKEILYILKKCDLREGFKYNASQLKKSINAIRQYYLSQGYLGIQIDRKIKEKSGKVSIDLHIYKGNIAKIKKISIIGNTIFSDEKLLKSLYHKTGNWFSWYTKSDQYVHEKFLADLEIIRNLYMNNGYLNIKIVESQVLLSSDKKNIYLTIQLQEGTRYYFSDVKVEGYTVIPKKQIEKIVYSKIKSGWIFSRKNLLEIKNKIELILGNNGYSQADVGFDLNFKEKSNLVNIIVRVTPGRKVMVRNINFKGNILTKDDVLRHNIYQQETTWISTSKMKKDLAQLIHSGYVKDATIKTDEISKQDNQIDIVYQIREMKNTNFQASINYNEADKLIFIADAELKNFLGSGIDIVFDFEHAKTFNNYTFSYNNPRFFKDEIGIGYSLYYRKTKLRHISDMFKYATHKIGGDVHWSVPLSRYSHFTFGVGYNNTHLLLNDTVASLEIRKFINLEGNRFNQYYVGGIYYYNALDKVIFTKNGIVQNLGINVSMPMSDLKYYKIDYNFAIYKQLFNHVVGHLSVILGYADSYDSTYSYPFFRHYYSGGSNSVRGFEERSLGPRNSQNHELGGNVLTNIRAGLDFPVPFFRSLESMRTSLFLDAGQVYDTRIQKRNICCSTDSIDPTGGLRYSVGISWKWITPLGPPIEISLAKPLNAKYGDKIKFLSFGVLMNIS